MLIKVCGILQEKDFLFLNSVEEISHIGVIFYPKSKRFYEGETILKISKKITGVFVNENFDNIIDKTLKLGISTIQLHGEESPEFCNKLKENFEVIKAFQIHDDFDFTSLENFKDNVDYFLFDTKTIGYGGSGKQFNWKLLEKYKLEIPFFLSGGINPGSVSKIKEIQSKQFHGFDLNSGFENSPGDKNQDQIRKFIKELKDEKLI